MRCIYMCLVVVSVAVISVFFFFFKQKTAYEMRISDWSSDVCSSDLHDRADFASDLASFAGKRIAADPERAVAAIFDRLEQGGADVLELRDPAVLPKAVKNGTEIAGHKAAQARDGAALSRFLHWLSVEAPRSEEHTSELQSLMRISYAVFCLKKNNTKTTP